ncbi:hypothetical protein Hamer_G016672 [Homarus americanus]|uniref:Uncharacterized protein n=1 Tax=Homarus americanus TaxID=6706 RepID=A0A8J5NCT9_HOMAM|nr:hypothetical protein Hamer_G016672 [Homarus americanus]
MACSGSRERLQWNTNLPDLKMEQELHHLSHRWWATLGDLMILAIFAALCFSVSRETLRNQKDSD